MKAVGAEWMGSKKAERSCLENKVTNHQAGWRMGFHAIPSLPQLHLHVISQVSPEKDLDKNNPCPQIMSAPFILNTWHVL